MAERNWNKEIVPTPAISPWLFLASLQVCDTIVVISSAFTALAVAKYWNSSEGPSSWACLQLALVVVVGVQFVFHSMKIYRIELLYQNINSLALPMIAWSIAIGPLVLLATVHDPRGQYATAWIVVWFAAGITSIAVLRAIASLVGTHFVRTGLLGHNVCVVATSSEAATLGLKSTTSLNVMAMLGYFSPLANDGESAELRCLGSVDDLPEFIRGHRVDEVLVVTSVLQTPGLLGLLQSLPVRVRVLQSALRIAPGNGNFGNTQLLELYKRPLEGWQWVLKDFQDRLVAMWLLLALSPVFAVIALGIRISSQGPVFFLQNREGYGGRIFRIIKFRTMHASCSVETQNLDLARRGDPRIFSFGALLRRTSLDELPQLLNVLRGDMWLVGPRPHSPLAKAEGQRYADVIALYWSRYRIKPGMTGWAQVNGWRGPTDTVEQIEQRVLHDLYYIENWSIFFDWRILVRTGWVSLVGQNAY
jgi:Undecaprenyl-phosphate glucose phosphotransferase